MTPYSYIVSLEIRHPHLPPATITDTLSIKPNTTFPPRHDYQTFWAHHFELRDDGDLPKFFSGLIEKLRQHRTFLRHIRDGGGRVECVIAVIELGAKLQVTLPHDLLQALGDMGVSIDFTLYEHKPEESPSV